MKSIYDWLISLFHKPQIYLGYRVFRIFQELSSYELYLLHGIVHQRSFKANEVLYEAGYPMEVIYLIIEGEISLNDVEHQIGKDKVLGLWDMFSGAKRNSTAIALTDVSVYAISRSDLMELMEARPRLGMKILQGCCAEIVQDALILRAREH